MLKIQVVITSTAHLQSGVHVCRLAQLCKARETAYEGRYQNLASGTIIDTPGCQTQAERNVTKIICEAFAADVIMVVGDDKLHSMLQSAFQVRPEITELRKLKCNATTHACVVGGWGGALYSVLYLGCP